MNVAILGATSGMGRAVARHMASRGDRVFLLGRSTKELAKSAADLESRGAPGPVEYAPCDLEDVATFAPALQVASTALQKLDAIVVTAGLFGLQDDLENDLEFTRKMLVVNHAHTVLFCEVAKQLLLNNGGGTLCVFSSVAGDRGRKPVALYGSSKAGLSHYLESLDHKHRADGLITLCVKPGFVKTSMTHGLKPPPFAGEPDQVAAQVVRAIDSGVPLIYTPFMWRWVMLVIRSLPRFVMRKINF